MVAGGAGLGGWYFLTRGHTARPDLILHAIKREKLRITIVDRGTLESAENNEIVCKVKAKAQGAAATSIRWVIDNGTMVRKGDKVVELDDSALQDAYIAEQILMEQAKGAWEAAVQTAKIDASADEAAITTAEVLLKVNQITLKEYLEGLNEQTRVDLDNKLVQAQSDLAMWQERAAWSQRMSRPGRQYVTISQAEADEARRLSADLTLKNIETQLRVYKELTDKRNETQFRGEVEKAIIGLKSAKLQAEAHRITDESSCTTTKLTYEKELGKLRDLEKELEHCDLRAPKDGMVVYWIEERSRWGGGKQRIVAQGEPVDEGQKLMTIPNLTKMVVNTRVHEAMAPRVRADVKQETGFSTVAKFGLYLQPDPLRAATTATAFTNDVFTPFISAYRKAEQQLVSHGQKAMIRVSAFPDHQLHGRVTYISAVASVNDLFASDVKVYQTYVSIDESMEGLRPGMDAEVTIEVDSQPEPVLAIPLQAILGGVEKGKKRNCFVMTEDGPRKREITLGMSNEKMVEVEEGLEEDEVVVLNPVMLLSAKERMEYGNLPARGSGRQGQGGKGKGGKGGGQGGDAKQPGGGKSGGGMSGGQPKAGGAPQGGRPSGG
ncbi:MAG TPA: hypothetical protein VH575_23520 [Gemmataceae bacterium]